MSSTVSEFEPVAAATSIRARFCDAVFESLNATQVRYCVPGGDRAYNFADSDLDLVIHPDNGPEIAALLKSAAQRADGHLVQAIQHETNACYYVLARQESEEIGFLNPDFITDYRRQGRLWLRADELLRSRKLVDGALYVPSPDGELLYYLIKKVLKQSISEAQWKKLRDLYGAGRCGLRLEMQRFWQPVTAKAIEEAIQTDNFPWFRANLGPLLAELLRSPWQETATQRLWQRAQSAARYWRRLVQPTGLLVRVVGGTVSQRAKLAQSLTRKLAPAFRHTWVVPDRLGSASSIATLRALVRSTLVLDFDHAVPLRPGTKGVEVLWRKDLSSAQNLTRAMELAIQNLSCRTCRRLGLSSEDEKADPRRRRESPQAHHSIEAL